MNTGSGLTAIPSEVGSPTVNIGVRSTRNTVWTNLKNSEHKVQFSRDTV